MDYWNSGLGENKFVRPLSYVGGLWSSVPV
jgi:hypothetical protein